MLTLCIELQHWHHRPSDWMRLWPSRVPVQLTHLLELCFTLTRRSSTLRGEARVEANVCVRECPPLGCAIRRVVHTVPLLLLPTRIQTCFRIEHNPGEPAECPIPSGWEASMHTPANEAGDGGHLAHPRAIRQRQLLLRPRLRGARPWQRGRQLLRLLIISTIWL